MISTHSCFPMFIITNLAINLPTRQCPHHIIINYIRIPSITDLNVGNSCSTMHPIHTILSVAYPSNTKEETRYAYSALRWLPTWLICRTNCSSCPCLVPVYYILMKTNLMWPKNEDGDRLGKNVRMLRAVLLL